MTAPGATIAPGRSPPAFRGHGADLSAPGGRRAVWRRRTDSHGSPGVDPPPDAPVAAPSSMSGPAAGFEASLDPRVGAGGGHGRGELGWPRRHREAGSRAAASLGDVRRQTSRPARGHDPWWLLALADGVGGVTLPPCGPATSPAPREFWPPLPSKPARLLAPRS